MESDPAIGRLLRPKSVAIVGASSDPQKTAGRPLRVLRAHGFDGEIYPVNPRAEMLEGLTCYRSVRDLPAAPDAALVLVGARHAERAVRELAEIGTGAAIVFAGGYAEIGPEGAARQQALRDAARPMRLLGPNTVGLVNLTDRVTLSASGVLDAEPPASGRIALVSQSGGILGSIHSRAAARGIALSKLVATGNEADLEVCDFVEALAADDATAVIALYLEGLRDGARFRRAARDARRRGKRLVVFKVGRSEAGSRAAASHTGALAGQDRVYDALCEDVGAVRVARFGELLDVAMALSTGRRIAGRRLAVLTTTGGAGALVADACGAAGFDTPRPARATAARLKRLIEDEGFAADRNPVDLTLAGTGEGEVRGALAALAESPDYDAVAAIVGSSWVGRPERAADTFVPPTAATAKPVVAYVSPSAPDILRGLNLAGLPAYDAPESCAAALDALRRQGEPMPPGDARRPSAPALPPALADRSGPLDEHESLALFAAFGIPCARAIPVGDSTGAMRAAEEIGGRVALKLLSRAVAHKTEIGGVIRDVEPPHVPVMAERLFRTARGLDPAPDRILVQEWVTGGVEVILGTIRDAQFGPVVLLGAGGSMAELHDDTVLALPPVGPAAARRMIGRLAVGRLLAGYRGAKPADIDALIRAVAAFSQMCEVLGDRLVEAEINPLIVLPEGEGVRAVDGLAVLR